MASIPFEFPTLINLHVIQNLCLTLWTRHQIAERKFWGVVKMRRSSTTKPMKIGSSSSKGAAVAAVQCTESTEWSYSRWKNCLWSFDWRVFPSAFLNTNFPNMWQYSAKIQFIVFQKFCSEKSEMNFWYIIHEIMGFQKKSEKSAMCTVPKPHQPPQGAYFDTLTVLYQNEKYWPQAVFWQHILDLGYFMFSKVNILCSVK